MSSPESIDLSNMKWRWLSERDDDALAGLFHRDAVFVHMGATFARAQELEIIRSGGIAVGRLRRRPQPSTSRPAPLSRQARPSAGLRSRQAPPASVSTGSTCSPTGGVG